MDASEPSQLAKLPGSVVVSMILAARLSELTGLVYTYLLLVRTMSASAPTTRLLCTLPRLPLLLPNTDDLQSKSTPVTSYGGVHKKCNDYTITSDCITESSQKYIGKIMWKEKSQQYSLIKTKYCYKFKVIGTLMLPIVNDSHPELLFSDFRPFILMLSLLSSELASLPESTEACFWIFLGFGSILDEFSSSRYFSELHDEAALTIFSLASGYHDVKNTLE